MFRGSDGVPLGCRSVRLPPIDPAGEGQDQGRVVGGDTGPSVPHIGHTLVFYLTGVIKIEILYFLQWFVRVLGCTEPLQKELKYL